MASMINQGIKRCQKYLWAKFAAKDRPINRDIRRIILVIPYGIGDALLANGAIKSLKKAYPAAQFTVIHRERPTAEMLAVLGGFKDIFFFEFKPSIKRNLWLLRMLRNERFDAAVFFRGNDDYRFNFLFFASGIPVRIGFDTNIGDSNSFLTHPVKYEPRISAFENNLNLIRVFNIAIDRSIDFKVKKHAFTELEGPGLRVGVHIGRANSKKPGWTAERFAELGSMLINKSRAKIFAFGGIEEQTNAVYLGNTLKENFINLIGRANLEETISYISQMHLFISNDTALMHIAASQGVPLVAIFGPTDYIQCGPVAKAGANIKIVYKGCHCSPCYLNNAQEINECKTECLDRITVNDIVNAVNELSVPRMRHKKRLSIIIPTYQRADSLPMVLSGLLPQKEIFDDVEVIVIDDGSTDGTREKIEMFMKASPANIRYIYQSNSGSSAARNLGIREARGDILLFLDADIIPSEALISAHKEFHEKYPDANFVLKGGTKALNEDEEWLREIGSEEIHRKLGKGRAEEYEELWWDNFITNNISVKKDFLSENGVFDEEMPVMVDVELGRRLSKRGMRLFYDGKALGYHMHPIDPTQYFRYAEKYGSAMAIWYYKYPSLKEDLKDIKREYRYGLFSLREPEKALKYVLKRLIVNGLSVGLFIYLGRALKTRNPSISGYLYRQAFRYYERRAFNKQISLLMAKGHTP